MFCKNINIGITGLFIILLSFSCTREDLVNTPDGPQDGRVRMELNLQTAYQDEVQAKSTRSTAAEEDYLDPNGIYVLVLDGAADESLLKQNPVKASFTSDKKIYALMDEESTASYLCVLSNLSDANKNYLSSVDLTKGDVTFADVRAQLTLPAATSRGITHPFPMSGLSSEIASIKKGAILPSATTTISLTRAVARIDVVVTEAPEKFTITGVTLANAAKQGWHLPLNVTQAQSLSGVVQYAEATTVAGNAVKQQIYCYENNGKLSTFVNNPTRIVVKGHYNDTVEDTYYGIEIAYGDDPQNLKYDITRNKTYTVNIKKVDNVGFRTLEEALRNVDVNSGIQADIEVSDPYAHDIVTNGKQYLGTTNSDMLIHPLTRTSVVSGAMLATISYTTDPNWGVGEIILPAGITFAGGTTKRLDVGEGGRPVVRDILINVAPTFTSGDVIVQIGNLKKNIHVRRQPPVSAVGGICEDFSGKDYVKAEVIHSLAGDDWIKLSDVRDPVGESSLLDKITNPSGGIYLHYTSNTGFEGSAVAREASFYVTSKNDEQRSRVLIQQDKFDVYRDESIEQILPHSYVGTFHRWNQTAERIIRMDAKAYCSGSEQWTATVVSGDFIVLSTDDPSEGIHKDQPYGVGDDPKYKTDEDIEAHCQVAGTAQTVTGNGPNVYFKVGMKSKLASAVSQPRYGLIAVQHPRGVHLIYVRQGEEPDYVMRPWDECKYPGATSQRYAMRLNAVKVTPYNLTDPKNETGGRIDRKTRGYGFVQYPSQAGYYFQYGTTYAFPVGEDNNTMPDQFANVANWSSAVETCPMGYRRPHDGLPPALIAINAGKVDGSEVRQSFWLYPLDGHAQSDNSNQYRGYLADGFFDRRPIKDGLSTFKPATLIRVSENNHHAYSGMIVYNPKTLASVFIPEGGSCGTSFDTSSRMNNDGIFGGFWTKTSVGTAAAWLVNFGDNPVGTTMTNVPVVFDNYSGNKTFGWSIRCIKDENPPIQNDSNTVESFDPDTSEIWSIRHDYNDVATSLQNQLETQYTHGELGKMNSIFIFGTKTLTTEYYAYLNDMASNASNALRHIVISGSGNMTIPRDAFTSPKWITITFYEANNIEAEALHFTAGCNLLNLKFGNFDALTIDEGAFDFGTRNTLDINIFLAGVELKNANASTSIWRNIKWRSVKNYYNQ